MSARITLSEGGAGGVAWHVWEHANRPGWAICDFTAPAGFDASDNPRPLGDLAVALPVAVLERICVEVMETQARRHPQTQAPAAPEEEA